MTNKKFNKWIYKEINKNEQIDKQIKNKQINQLKIN